MSATTSQTLAERAIGARGDTLLVQAALVVAGSLLLAISAQFKVPIGPVPFTLQTLVLLVIAASYGRNLAVAAVIAYFAQGAVGLPVFANGGGFVHFYGPTAGFLLAFLPVAAIVGEAADRGMSRSFMTLAPVMLLAEVVLFGMGFAWLALAIGAGKAFAAAVAPFILPDLVKIAIAALAVPAGWALLSRR